MEADKVTELLGQLFINLNVLLGLIFIAGFTEGLKRVAEVGLGWGTKRLYIALFPLVPETTGCLLALIPGTVPDVIKATPWIVKLGFGIAAGTASSKVWKILTAFMEKPDLPPAAPGGP